MSLKLRFINPIIEERFVVFDTELMWGNDYPEEWYLTLSVTILNLEVVLRLGSQY